MNYLYKKIFLNFNSLLIQKIKINFFILLACFFYIGYSNPVHAFDISGASTIEPIVEKLIPIYLKNGGENIQLSAGGSSLGVKNALSEKSQIGMVSRNLSAEEKSALKFIPLAIDALVIIVHQSNPMDALSKNQLIDLYAGKINNWSVLGGPNQPVVRVSKEVGRSTLELFEHYTGLVSPDRPSSNGKPLIHKRTYVIGSNNEALTLVGGMPNAIGYVSFGSAETLKAAGMPIKILKLDNIVPSHAAFVNGSYPIVRQLNLVYKNESPPVNNFIALALSEQGQSIVKSMGFIPMQKNNN